MPFYDRTELINSAVETVTESLFEEMIVASLAIILVMWHFRSTLIICLMLPLAVLVSFIMMKLLGISSNIMSLAGIAISIGVLVDAAIVMVEQAHKKLEHWDAEGRAGDRRSHHVPYRRLGFGEPRRRAIDAALAGTDYMPDRRPRDGEWVAYRFRSEAAAWTFKENVARAQLAA